MPQPLRMTLWVANSRQLRLRKNLGRNRPLNIGRNGTRKSQFDRLIELVTRADSAAIKQRIGFFNKSHHKEMV